MKITKKFGILMLLFALMIFTLFGCGIQSTDLSSSQTDKTDLNETSTEESEDKDASESQDGEKREVIDELWEKLDGVWRFKEYVYMGQVVLMNEEHTLEFQYIDKIPCMVKNIQYKDEFLTREQFVYECSADDEYHYNIYVYKKDSYNGTDSPWSDDVLLVWYGLDLTNLGDGELLVNFHTSYDNGYVDNNHLHRYQIED